MSTLLFKSLLAFAAGAAIVVAHGHVNNIVVAGAYYQGYDPTVFPYQPNPPIVVGWTASDTDNGFVAADAYASSDIICHKEAKNAKGHAPVVAGDSIVIQWNTWPESHKGPVLDYLANCGDSCETVDKTTLEFFKIDEVGLVAGTGSSGTWGADQLRANNNSWTVIIPKNIAPGNYVLRHEIIALHGAGNAGGAQSYPQCFNLQITGSGTDKPAGTIGTKLYTANDAGVLVNIYQDLRAYVIPGPKLIAGAVAAKQIHGDISATATAVTGPGTPGPAPKPEASSTSTSAAAQSPTVLAASAELTPTFAKPASSTPTRVSCKKHRHKKHGKGGHH